MWDLSRLANDRPAVGAAFDDGSTASGIDSKPTRCRRVHPNHQPLPRRLRLPRPNEWDTAFETWETDPALALTLIDRMRGADESHEPAVQRRRMAAEARGSSRRA